MKPKEIILLIFIMVAGVFFYYAHTGRLHIEWSLDDHLFFFNLEEFTFQETQNIKPPYPPLLQIENAHGDVEIQGSEEEKIIITFQKIIWRKNEQQAKEVSDELDMIIDKNEQRLSVSTNQSEFRRRNFETNFRISVPPGINIEVKNSHGLVKTKNVSNTHIYNRHGKIIASQIDGELFIQNSYQDVEVDHVKSNCQVESKHSDLFIHRVEGDATLDHRYGRIHVEDVSKNTKIEGSHSEVFGQSLLGEVEVVTSYKDIILIDVGPTRITGSHSSVEVEGAEHSLDIQHKYGKIKLSNIQGNLFINGKNVEIYGRSMVGEKISVSSSYRNLEMVDFSGETSITLSHGEITLEPLPLTHPVNVRGDYANINFYWPPGEKYPFEARAKGGDILWNHPSELTLREENGITAIKAFVEEKDKPSIFLSTRYGIIRVKEQTKM
ncbi:MAG: hypothetical protein ACLFVG_08450 [Candidatus Aminicenantes bacterium]